MSQLIWKSPDFHIKKLEKAQEIVSFSVANIISRSFYFSSDVGWSHTPNIGCRRFYTLRGTREFVEMHGLDAYDYGARLLFSDRGGSWMSVDPHAENYYSISPYAYCAGNPVKFIDPDGRGLYDNIMKFGSDLLKSFTVNTSVGFQVGVKATVAGKGVEVKANVASANLGGVANGKSTFNLANPLLTKEATVKYPCPFGYVIKSKAGAVWLVGSAIPP